MTTIANPVLRGFHPDPCLCQAHGKYYLATSTFQWVPAVSLYESDDLITWHSIGGALPDLDLRGVRDSAGVWAPDLSYDETNNLFWLTYTIAYQIDGVFKDVCNYVVTARDPHGPWSKPVFVNASGFDPGFFHENGRHYVINPQWDPRPIDGHHKFNGLVMQEFSLEDGLIGEAQVVLDNGDAVNWLREGPHVLKHDQWYYIACAEGGTGRRHRIRMARSHELWGPYEMCPEPLVCAWLSDSPLRRTGHGNFAQAPDGSWYVSFLCSRYLPQRDGSKHAFDEHESGYSVLGRETGMARIVWQDGWPRLAEGACTARSCLMCRERFPHQANLCPTTQLSMMRIDSGRKSGFAAVIAMVVGGASVPKVLRSRAASRRARHISSQNSSVAFAAMHGPRDAR